MDLSCGPFALTLFDDQTFTPGSADNFRRYDREYCFVKESRPVLKHGLICRLPEGVTHSCILLAGGGPSQVHAHSAVVVNWSCFICVGEMLCALSVPFISSAAISPASKVGPRSAGPGSHGFPGVSWAAASGGVPLAAPVTVSEQVVPPNSPCTRYWAEYHDRRPCPQKHPSARGRPWPARTQVCTCFAPLARDRYPTSLVN
jgi:hypothetical protein